MESLSLFVGTAECNANCPHCAGVPWRKFAPEIDGTIDAKLMRKTLVDCYAKGARYLSISSSGEPTLSPLSVTKTLKLIRDEGLHFHPINLYSNGIRIGKDKKFCDEYLPLWNILGLTTIYVTVHNTNPKLNARAYGVPDYPPLEKVVSRIHDNGLLMRANIVLGKDTIYSAGQFADTVEYLMGLNVNSISAWSVRDLDDKVDVANSPSEEELDNMDKWLSKNRQYRVRLIRENKHSEIYDSGKKLTLFQNGVLSNSWCKS